MLVYTKTGSIYKLDLESKTWERLSATDESGPLRSDSGTYIDIGPIQVGYPLLMECPPINPPMPRMIVTSIVVKVQDDNL